MKIDIGNGLVIKKADTWLEKKIASKTRWVAWNNVIYAPDYFWVDYTQRELDQLLGRWNHIIAHECKHIEQQRNTGLCWWTIKYLLSKKFRLSQEVEGIIVEVRSYTNDPKKIATIFDEYSDELSSRAYYWCATKAHALVELWNAYKA